MKELRLEEAVTAERHASETRAGENGRSDAVRRIEQSVEYMRQHLDKPLQVGALAALVNISPSHYFALFKRFTGSAPIDYFTRLRMQRARELLEKTELSVKEIASVLGYEDPFYFSRVFKSINRAAPSDYRDSHRHGTNGCVNGSYGWDRELRERSGAGGGRNSEDLEFRSLRSMVAGCRHSPVEMAAQKVREGKGKI